MAVAKYIESTKFNFGQEIKSEIMVLLLSETGKTVFELRKNEVDTNTVADLNTKYDNRFKEAE